MSAADDEFPTLRHTNGDGPLAIVSERMSSTGRYQIGETIGRGGMGEVFAARDTLIGRDVAIKRLRGVVPDIALDRFMREACIQGRLDHPAIVPVHELGVGPDGVPFFVMRKLSGRTLTRVIAQPESERPSRQRLLRAFVDICLAVAFAHERGFIHRDLKPDNIVLGDYGEVYVIDWGVAKVVGSIDPQLEQAPGDPLATRAGVTVGTAGYMAPEQVRGDRDIDGRVDVYALGCLLFEILSGERLHPKGAAGLDSALRGVDARASVRAPHRDVPPELDAICVVATATERDERPALARSLADMVEAFLDGDRDLEVRRRLSSEHVAAAQRALTSTTEVTESRGTAMRLAGRALALDPLSEPAAVLVGRLMLEPPREVPREVERAVELDRLHTNQRTARFVMFAYASYILVLAAFALIGFGDESYPILFGVLIAINIGLLARYARSPVPLGPLPLLLASAAMVALLARMFSPFFVAPGVAAVTAMAFTSGFMPATWTGAVTTLVLTTGAIVLPYLAEVAGWLSPSFVTSPTQIAIIAPGVRADAEVTGVLLVCYVLVLLGVAVLMTRAVRRTDDALRQSLHLQSWQLRQLVTLSPQE